MKFVAVGGFKPESLISYPNPTIWLLPYTCSFGLKRDVHNSEFNIRLDGYCCEYMAQLYRDSIRVCEDPQC